MMASAALFGLLAVFVAQAWINHQAELRMKSMERPKAQVVTKTVVVAGAPLRFGSPITPQSLREVAWPEGAVPAGTFSSISELLAPGKRIVLSSIEPNEPILASKITGPGQKGTLSAIIQDGMKAVTIRVNDVDGVAGFVLPGDHVDVLVTRQSDKLASSTDVVLQNIRVLAIDQIADDAAEKPTVARAVTLEVDTPAAQRLSLAGSIGALSLALRKAGEQTVEGPRRVTVIDLDSPYLTARPIAVETKPSSSLITVTVTRAGKGQDYSVPAEGTSVREANGPEDTKQ
ncbi:MAG TPA: Flp pilus assembly protein CpaB [Xanthobacteraceae bacterium]|nr:Flp pilus assembly protein CpaB [Xanthobacteraceae bacterium]